MFVLNHQQEDINLSGYDIDNNRIACLYNRQAILKTLLCKGVYTWDFLMPWKKSLMEQKIL